MSEMMQPEASEYFRRVSMLGCELMSKKQVIFWILFEAFAVSLDLEGMVLMEEEAGPSTYTLENIQKTNLEIYTLLLENFWHFCQ